MKSVKIFKKVWLNLIAYAACILLPLAQIPFVILMRKRILDGAKEKNIQIKISLVPLIIFSVLLPLMPINLITLIILQHKANKLIGARNTTATNR